MAVTTIQVIYPDFNGEVQPIVNQASIDQVLPLTLSPKSTTYSGFKREEPPRTFYLSISSTEAGQLLL